MDHSKRRCGRCGGDGKAHGSDRPFEGDGSGSYPGPCPVCRGSGVEAVSVIEYASMTTHQLLCMLLMEISELQKAFRHPKVIITYPNGNQAMKVLAEEAMQAWVEGKAEALILPSPMKAEFAFPFDLDLLVEKIAEKMQATPTIII